MDVTRRQEHTLLLEKAVKTFGHVDVVWREDIGVGGKNGGREAGWWLDYDKRERSSTIHSRSLPLSFLSSLSLPQWVNNAGRGINKSILEVTEEDFDEMMSVNAKSAMFGMQAAYPYFVVSRRGGREGRREGGGQERRKMIWATIR